MPLKLGSDIPKIEGATEWIGGSVSSEACVGRVTLVHFWSVSCGVCKQQYPTIHAWKDQFGPRGLHLVAVHMPRQETDTDADAVKKVIAELGISEPCAIDNEHALKEAFQNDQGWVPAYFLYDQEGKLRSRTAGEHGLHMMQGALERLLPPLDLSQNPPAGV